MTEATPKSAVAQRFDRAAADYDRLAYIQREAAALLSAHLPAETAALPWLDAGCGTGGAIRDYFPGPALALDFAPAMARRAHLGGCPAICGDIESLPLQSGSIGLYWSSLAWQWCALDRALCEAHRVLTPGGYLRIATLGPGTLGELREAFAQADRARHVIDFSPPSALHTAALAAGFESIELHTHTLTAWHPDVASLLRDLKQLGAAEVGNERRRGLMGKRAWQSMVAAYEQHRQSAGLPARYDVILLIARKPT